MPKFARQGGHNDEDEDAPRPTTYRDMEAQHLNTIRRRPINLREYFPDVDVESLREQMRKMSAMREMLDTWSWAPTPEGNAFWNHVYVAMGRLRTAANDIIEGNEEPPPEQEPPQEWEDPAVRDTIARLREEYAAQTGTGTTLNVDVAAPRIRPRFEYTTEYTAHAVPPGEYITGFAEEYAAPINPPVPLRWYNMRGEEIPPPGELAIAPQLPPPAVPVPTQGAQLREALARIRETQAVAADPIIRPRVHPRFNY